CRTRRRRRDGDRPDLSSRSRLRADRGEAVRIGRQHSAPVVQRYNGAMVTIALSKGRIFDQTLPLLAAAGVVPSEDPETSRKLIIGTNRDDTRIIIVRASDVPTYVQYGAADLGVAGKDVLLEHGGDGLYQPLDLDIARCRMMAAVASGLGYAKAVQSSAPVRVPTK